jgi:hypothetical protein
MFQTNHTNTNPRQTHTPGSRGMGDQLLSLPMLSLVLETSEFMTTLDFVKVFHL